MWRFRPMLQPFASSTEERDAKAGFMFTRGMSILRQDPQRPLLLTAVAIVPLLAVSGWCVGSCSDNREGYIMPKAYFSRCRQFHRR